MPLSKEDTSELMENCLHDANRIKSLVAEVNSLEEDKKILIDTIVELLNDDDYLCNILQEKHSDWCSENCTNGGSMCVEKMLEIKKQTQCIVE